MSLPRRGPHGRWSMVGKANFVGKAVHMFVDMDAMIGTSSEKALARMKSIVEAGRSEG